jgi:hypothetical protein
MAFVLAVLEVGSDTMVAAENPRDRFVFLDLIGFYL